MFAMDDAQFVRGREGVRDLLRNGQRVGERHGSARDVHRGPRRRQVPSRGLRRPALFEAVDGGDVWVVERGEGLGFTLEAREPISIVGERLGQRFDGDVAIQFRITGAKYLPIPPSPMLAITS